MPEIGEKARIWETPKRSAIYIYTACEICGKEQWIPPHKSHLHEPLYKVCKRCVQIEQFIKQSGGRHMVRGGYVSVRLLPNNPFYSMTKKGWVLEHRLVMAQHINRCLKESELVHHKNGNRQDNRFGNLELVNTEEHLTIAIQQKEIERLTRKIKDLEQRIERNTKAGSRLEWIHNNCWACPVFAKNKIIKEEG